MLSLAATGALALLGLAAGFAKPETAAVFLVGLAPLLPALPRLLADPKPGSGLLPVAVATLGAAAARRLRDRDPSPLPRPLLRWAGAFLAVAWASAVSSSIRGETLFLLSRGGARPLYVNDLMMAAADRTRDAGRIFLALALLLLALDAFARVAEKAQGARRLLTALAAGSLTAFLLTALESRLPVPLTVPPWTYIARRAGPFTDPNALGVAAALAAPLLVAAVLDATRWSLRRVMALAALLLAPVAIELSGSRSAILLLAVAAPLGAAGLWRSRRGLRAMIVAAAVVIVAGAVALTFVLPRGGAIARGGLATRLGAVLSSSSLDDVSSHRPLFWRTAFETVEDEPLSGCGLGGFPYEFPARYAKRHSAVHVTDNATNALLDTAAECGLPGLVLALAAVVPLLVRALDAALGLGTPEALRRLDALDRISSSRRSRSSPPSPPRSYRASRTPSPPNRPSRGASPPSSRRPASWRRSWSSRRRAAPTRRSARGRGPASGDGRSTRSACSGGWVRAPSGASPRASRAFSSRSRTSGPTGGPCS